MDEEYILTLMRAAAMTAKLTAADMRTEKTSVMRVEKVVSDILSISGAVEEFKDENEDFNSAWEELRKAEKECVEMMIKLGGRTPSTLGLIYKAITNEKRNALRWTRAEGGEDYWTSHIERSIGSSSK